MKRRSRSRVGAFTLVELLVAMAVISVMAVLFLQMISWTSKSWAEGRQLADNLGKSRAAFDIITRDVQAGILRPDLGGFVSVDSSVPKNFCLYVARGGRGDRSISIVRYRIGANATLLRQTLPIDWDGSNSGNMAFGTTTIPSASDLDSKGSSTELVTGVVAFGIYFLNSGPKGDSPVIENSYTNSAQSSSRALGICMIVLDERTEKLLASQGRLDAFLSSSAWNEPGSLSRGLRAHWQAAIDSFLSGPEGANLPQNVRTGIRVFETVVPLPNTAQR
ncbi:Verru_Chthon cassette protein C [Terrimicrobium sacchariphilum]|jgi:prepilin-type N-terminal cleavage/methylation domain-containing protein|uniref:Verru_Chthon cassette protein C n=1 Tax=Terrimicrobium sacchariphilum TaxID=690879 RepID=A0A146G3G1_TERSA|nr:type II secretion system protein [Terrimicrobium sacchariphilum]GAT32190.1 Verru_Chthon cassette protein C [Terrimicrobium sacchariphilum]